MAFAWAARELGDARRRERADRRRRLVVDEPVVRPDRAVGPLLAREEAQRREDHRVGSDLLARRAPDQRERRHGGEADGDHPLRVQGPRRRVSLAEEEGARLRHRVGDLARVGAERRRGAARGGVPGGRGHDGGDEREKDGGREEARTHGRLRGRDEGPGGPPGTSAPSAPAVHAPPPVGPLLLLEQGFRPVPVCGGWVRGARLRAGRQVGGGGIPGCGGLGLASPRAGPSRSRGPGRRRTPAS